MSTVARAFLTGLAVLVLSILLGGLTAWAQGHLPQTFAPFANSCSGWAVLAALLVAWARPSLWWGAALGVVSFVSLVYGYALAREVTGDHYHHAMFWSAVGVLAGPFVGAAAAAIVGRHVVRVALGAGALAGVLLADGCYGLTVISDSTSPVYGTLCLVAGAALVAFTVARLRTLAATTYVISSTVAALVVLSLGYATLNRVP
jgi:hypothetical protein